MEKKRKLKELYEESLKQQDTFRDDIRSEKEETRLKGKLREAQLVCQNLDTQAAEKNGITVEPNLLWRSLDRERDTEEKERRFKRRMIYEPSANPLGERDEEDYDNTVQPLEDEDPELDEFEALPTEEQLEKVLNYMREKYYYCFWYSFPYNRLMDRCGCAYDDAEDLAENCPGLSEDDH